jgi:hypothetical protein
MATVDQVLQEIGEECVLKAVSALKGIVRAVPVGDLIPCLHHLPSTFRAQLSQADKLSVCLVCGGRTLANHRNVAGVVETSNLSFAEGMQVTPFVEIAKLAIHYQGDVSWTPHEYLHHFRGIDDVGVREQDRPIELIAREEERL